MNPKPDSHKIICPICGREIPKTERIMVRISHDVWECMVFHLKPLNKPLNKMNPGWSEDFPGWHIYCAWSGWITELKRPE